MLYKEWISNNFLLVCIELSSIIITGSAFNDPPFVGCNWIFLALINPKLRSVIGWNDYASEMMAIDTFFPNEEVWDS